MLSLDVQSEGTRSTECPFAVGTLEPYLLVHGDDVLLQVPILFELLVALQAKQRC